MVFSSSNHVPFELPEGKIEWVEGVDQFSVRNAIKYSDYAVGRFFELARKEAYFANTVFVVVADHNVRVYGDDFVPVLAEHAEGTIGIAIGFVAGSKNNNALHGGGNVRVWRPCRISRTPAPAPAR